MGRGASIKVRRKKQTCALASGKQIEEGRRKEGVSFSSLAQTGLPQRTGGMGREWAEMRCSIELLSGKGENKANVLLGAGRVI